ncbi:MAG: TerB family tellurite resistance protein [Bacteroidales bacterium]|nr:TerB family tellurite resistance protein [Bacteroidales bacterium]MCF8344298.1 TerB family tellurite resistance protein [Bacteroidales bacterium]MCF8352205.1 TerB family tellurite resistance protein [Bacteroidales bacterium]MCF8377802.1 TerB family tellurite resistance protein [Bacteroidales bacterium]MCF8402172.1 TerB family tellurite resistance protein [Bacteroidales bacterium]
MGRQGGQTKDAGRTQGRQDDGRSKRTRGRRTYGKWVGGGLGWAFGGPIGAILGFAFGSMYDNMSAGVTEAYAPGQARTRPADFTMSLLVLAAAVMKADKRVMRSELDYVKAFLIRQFGSEAATEQIRLLGRILKQEINVYEVSTQIRSFMDYSSRLQLLHFLYGISNADGQLHPQEIDIIDLIAGYLGVSKADYQSIRSMFVKDTKSAYKILQITPDATDEEVKKAYHKMAIKYHPDKVSHLGEDVQKAAKEKFQELQNAYDNIKKERGMK